MQFVLLLLITITNALNSQKLYRTKGLNAINIDLGSQTEQNKGAITINIILENNQFSTVPFLAYCNTNNLQIIKSIISSPESIKKQIESNKKLCVFDNNAMLYSQRIQQIVLTDQINEENQQVYNKYSIYKLYDKKFSIYIYSSDDAQYNIILKSSQKGECYNQCNNNGQCMSNQILFCQCNQGYLDSTCQLQSTVINAPSLIQFEIKQKSFKNILTIPLNDKSTSLQIEVNSNATIITYLGCLLDQDFIPFYESNSFLQNEISTGMLKFSKDEIKQCQDNKNQMESMLGYKLDNYMIFLLVNDQNQKAQVELKLQIMIDEDKGSGLEIYYILAGAIGSLIFALLLILCVIYLQRKARKINIGTQNNQNLRLNSLKEIINRNLKQDQIPVELYEQIIQEYPGLIEISDCQICLVEFQKQDLVKLTYCLHLFHSICIDEWRKRNQTCPFCREDLTKQKCIQQRHEEQIYQLGVISGEAMQIDEQKLAEFQRREQRLKQQQQTSSPDSANGLQLKESTPSPFLKKDLINQQLCLQIKK